MILLSFYFVFRLFPCVVFVTDHFAVQSVQNRMKVELNQIFLTKNYSWAFSCNF